MLVCCNTALLYMYLHLTPSSSSSSQPTEEQTPAAIQPTVIQADHGGDSLLIGDLLSLDIGSEPAAPVDLGEHNWLLAVTRWSEIRTMHVLTTYSFEKCATPNFMEYNCVVVV